MTTISNDTIKQPAIRGLASKTNWCLFESHFFNSKTKVWEPADPSKGLRRCLHSKCTRKHKIPNRPVQICSQEADCPGAGIGCFLLHDNTKLEPLCYYGKSCVDLECLGYRHPIGRVTEICPLDANCPDALITCFKLHSMSKLIPLCHYREMCMNYVCSKRHPPGRKDICDLGSMCWEYVVNKEAGCPKLHPKIFQKVCRWDTPESTCKSYGCSFLHHPGAPTDCEVGMQCQTRIDDGDARCPYKHPKYTSVKTLEDGSLHFE